MKHTKIAIIGAGAVGSTTAYALMLRDIAAEIALVDINDLRCKGEMLDLSDTLALSMASSIQAQKLPQIRDADIIIFSAGVAQKPGQSRAELLATNKKVVTSVFDELKPINPHAVIIMITNPVDVLALHAQTMSGLPRNQVFGSGTLLDSLRLQYELSRKLNVAEESVNAYVLGEHGDSQFIAWSCAQVATTPIEKFLLLSDQEREAVGNDIKKKAYDIIDCKGATFYGIAACVTRICESIIFDQKRVLPLSTYIQELDVCLSLPVVLGEKGIEYRIPLQLNKKEEELLQRSSQKIKEYIS